MSPLKKLWVDDTRPAPPGWAWARTYSEAVAKINEGGWNHVSLDHDLGDSELIDLQELSGWGPSEAGPSHHANGYHVALHMVRERCFPVTVTVHSSNPSAAPEMVRLLNRQRLPSRLSRAERVDPFSLGAGPVDEKDEEGPGPDEA